jgi:hypothetical protein
MPNSQMGANAENPDNGCRRSANKSPAVIGFQPKREDGKPRNEAKTRKMNAL